jgi:hypothetical protein
MNGNETVTVFGKLSPINGGAIAVGDSRLRGKTISARLLRNDGTVFCTAPFKVTLGKFINAAPNGGIATWAKSCGRTERDFSGPKNHRNTVFYHLDRHDIHSLHFAELQEDTTGSLAQTHPIAVPIEPAGTKTNPPVVSVTSDIIEENPAMSPQDACAKLHELLEQLPFHGADCAPEAIPKSIGIYYFYEKTDSMWETSGHDGCSRGIVRIGISGGARGRISHHYHGVIPIHTMDMTTGVKRGINRDRRNMEVEKTIEHEVSDVLASNFLFRSVSCKSDSEAKALESSGIGIVSSCPICHRSPDWLGRSHPRTVISHGKLWNVQKVNTGFDGPLRLNLLAQRIKEPL